MGSGRQALIVAIVILLGAIGLVLWTMRDRGPITAGFWFDDIDPAATSEFAGRLGGPLTRGDIARIESIARDELHAAFASFCLPISASPMAMYGVRVHQELKGLIVGGSSSVPGLFGHGDVSFGALASNAVAFAPADADRDAIIQAIGRGIGRTAAHELAHQVLGAMDIHSKRDRRSYEYPDVRPEHFYGPPHWTVAEAPMRARLGRC